jgi:hypothetical protein
MPDVYNTITSAEPALVQTHLPGVGGSGCGRAAKEHVGFLLGGNQISDQRVS